MINPKLSSSISFVIPLYNNEKTLVHELKACLSILKKHVFRYEVIVCNDGSTDSSVRLLKQNFNQDPYVRILHHQKNLGIAPTLRHLYGEAKFDYIFLYSVDGDWKTEDIVRMLSVLEKTRADIIIGVRSQTNYTTYRKIVSFFYNLLPWLLFGAKTYDAGSIKIIKKSLFDSIKLSSKSVFFEAELIIKAAKQGANIATVKNIHYHKRNPKRGRGGKLTSVVQSFSDMIRLRLTQL